jgi:hypothetical protein
MLSQVKDILIDHTSETLELDVSEFYQELIQHFSEPQFRQQLDITTVFPKTQFYGFRAYLRDAQSLCCKPITDPPGPGDFWLIVRSHEHSLDSLRDYLSEECEAYNHCEVQENELAFIGVAPLPDAEITLVVFLAASITTNQLSRRLLQVPGFLQEAFCVIILISG